MKFTTKYWGYVQSVKKIGNFMQFVIAFISIVVFAVFTALAGICINWVVRYIRYLKNTVKTLERQINELAEYFNKKDSLNFNLRKFRHDYVSFLLSMRTMLEKSEYAEALDYVNNKSSSDDALTSSQFSSGNPLADVILSDKYFHALKAGAEIKFNGEIANELPCRDVCIILSNALDISILACEEMCSDEKKIIEIYGNFDNVSSSQFIRITFPNPKAIKNLYRLGIYSIQKSVKKLGGDVWLTSKDSISELFLFISD